MSGTYTIKLRQFEGPFDLLLFFIERDELDIHDIPIAKITDDFLDYIRQMEAINVDMASEFILVAATLMRIKAKLLIPRKEVDEEGNEIDPREELVQRLIEYKRYKAVLDEMRELEESRSLKNPRGSNLSRDLKIIANKALVDIELESLTLFKLMKAYERVMARLEDKKKKAVHRVFRYEHTVQGQQIFILSKVKRDKPVDFATIFGDCKTRMHAIITFLAMLELINLDRLKCIPGEEINSLWLSIPPEEDTRPDIIYDDEDEIQLDFPSEEGKKESTEDDTPALTDEEGAMDTPQEGIIEKNVELEEGATVALDERTDSEDIIPLPGASLEEE